MQNPGHIAASLERLQEDEPIRRPMRSRTEYRKCTRGARFNPLARALQSYVGRPWNEAHSRVLHRLRTTVRHAPMQLRWWLDTTVDTTCVVTSDGSIVSTRHMRHSTPYGLFVHPVDGTLQEGIGNGRVYHRYTLDADGIREKYLAGPVKIRKIMDEYWIHEDIRLIDSRRFAEKIDGSWHVHTYKPAESRTMVIERVFGSYVLWGKSDSDLRTVRQSITVPPTPARRLAHTRPLNERRVMKERGKIFAPPCFR